MATARAAVRLIRWWVVPASAGRPQDRRDGRNNQPQISRIAQMRRDDSAFICEICR